MQYIALVNKYIYLYFENMLLNYLTLAPNHSILYKTF